ncbi:MAG: hypothetical protein AB1295_04400 [Candidatus Micrarchaeota archaeon]
MAERQVDVRRILTASLLTIGIGIVLSILSMILQLLSTIITDDIGDILDITNGLYLLILFPLFFVLFFWTGIRAVKLYGFDVMEAGYITAFSYFMIGLVEMVLHILLAILLVRGPLDTVGFGSTEMVIASSIFGGLIGLSGVALSAVCGFGMLVFGSMVNFVVGGFGALFILNRRQQ